MAHSQLTLIPSTEAGRFQPHQQLSAWETAKARFLEGLDPAERKLFNEATVENLFYGTSVAQSQASKDSKIRAGFEKIKPLIAIIEEYGKALDVYAQIAPMYLSPIWGSIRVVLVIASSHSKYHGRMVEVLGRIGDLLPRFHDYEKLFDASEHPRFAEALSKAYLDIIELCTDFKKAIRDQKVSRMKRVFQPLSSSANLQFEDAIVRFKNHRKAIEKEAELCHMIEEKKSRDLVLRSKQEEDMRIRVYRQKDLVAQLSSLDHKYKHRRMQRLRHPGTGVWVLPIFEKWLNVTTSAILCCSGIPGSGKSILTSSLIDNAQNLNYGSKTAVIYFYCDHADEGTLDPPQIFSNITQQLLSMIAPLPETILTLLDEHLRHGRGVDAEDTMDLLLDVLKSFSSLILFLDGIDELSESHRVFVVKQLWRLVDTRSATLKIYIAGREDATRLTKAPDIDIFKIQISQEFIGEDICRFVEHEVHQLIGAGDLTISDSSLQREIITALSEGSRGMFLWVKFQLTDLCASDTDDSIRTTLQNLPRSLGETYDRLLKKVNKREDRRRELLKTLFNWLLCAKRPLTISEAREAIAFTIHDDHYDATKLPTDLQRFVRASGNLIIIDEATQNVQLAHYTVQQYLLQTQSPDPSFFSNTLEGANLEVAYICLAYLSFFDFKQQVTKYHDTGVNSGITAIESIVNNQTMLPSNVYGANAIKYIMGFRTGQTSTGIDFSRHALSPNSIPDAENRYAKYALLPYITENWLAHTFYMKDNGQLHESDGVIDLSISNLSLARYMLESLVFTNNFPFQLWPCDVVAFPRSEYQFVVQFGVAIRLNHAALATQLQAKTRHHSTEDISDHWQCIGKWVLEFWRERETKHVTPEIIDYMNVHYGGEFPTKDNWEGWTFSRIINAIAEDKCQSVQILLQAWQVELLLKDSTIRHGACALYGHLLLEAVLHSQASLAKFVCKKLLAWPAALSKTVLKLILIRIMFDGLDCNAVEIDILMNGANGRITVDFIAYTHSEFQGSLFATDKLQHAIIQRDTPRLTNFMQAMGYAENIFPVRVVEDIFYNPQSRLPILERSAAIRTSQSLSAEQQQRLDWEITQGSRTHLPSPQEEQDDGVYPYLIKPNEIDPALWFGAQAMKFCVSQLKDRESIAPKFFPGDMALCSLKYYSHWIRLFKDLNLLFQIDMLLICGIRPPPQCAEFLLKDAIHCEYQKQETILQRKRVERLIASGVPISGPGSTFSVLKEGLSFGFPFVALNIQELCPLYYAILHDRVDIVKVLLRVGGLSLDDPAYGSCSLEPEYLAILAKSTRMLKLLLDYRSFFPPVEWTFVDVEFFMDLYWKLGTDDGTHIFPDRKKKIKSLLDDASCVWNSEQPDGTPIVKYYIRTEVALDPSLPEQAWLTKRGRSIVRSLQR